MEGREPSGASGMSGLQQAMSQGGGGGGTGAGGFSAILQRNPMLEQHQLHAPAALRPLGSPNAGYGGPDGGGGSGPIPMVAQQLQAVGMASPPPPPPPPPPPQPARPGEPLKRKRGRPRKYGDGVSHALTGSPVSPPSQQQQHQQQPQQQQQQQQQQGQQQQQQQQPAPEKRRGRPPGTGKKQQLAALGSAGQGFTPHVITVAAGEDVATKIMSFSQTGPRAVCVLSANGAISNVTLRQPATSGGTVTYEGRFEILSLSGSFLLTESSGARSRTGGLSVSLAGPDGRVVGGGVAGLLMAATPVQVVVGSFLADTRRLAVPPAPAASKPASTALVKNEPSSRSADGPIEQQQSPSVAGNMMQHSGGMGALQSMSMGWRSNNQEPPRRETDINILPDG